LQSIGDGIKQESLKEAIAAQDHQIQV